MNRECIFLLFFIFILGNFSIAQNIKFNIAFPVISGLAASSYSIMNESDGYIMYGITVDSNNGDDPAISKIDSAGNILWRKYYRKIGFDFIPFAAANELGINVPWGGELAK
jgi:hypothetical protein